MGDVINNTDINNTSISIATSLPKSIFSFYDNSIITLISSGYENDITYLCNLDNNFNTIKKIKLDYVFSSFTINNGLLCLYVLKYEKETPPNKIPFYKIIVNSDLDIISETKIDCDLKNENEIIIMTVPRLCENYLLVLKYDTTNCKINYSLYYINNETNSMLKIYDYKNPCSIFSILDEFDNVYIINKNKIKKIF